MLYTENIHCIILCIVLVYNALYYMYHTYVHMHLVAQFYILYLTNLHILIVVALIDQEHPGRGVQLPLVPDSTWFKDRSRTSWKGSPATSSP